MDERHAALLQADGFDGVCAFVNDDLSAPVIDKLVEAVRAAVVARPTSDQSAHRLTDLQSSPSTSSPDTRTQQNVGLIALRSAGCNNVDMEHIVQSGYSQLSVVHVPAYSPHAVAEHALAMLMTLNRRTHKVGPWWEG